MSDFCPKYGGEILLGVISEGSNDLGKCGTSYTLYQFTDEAELVYT